uniref:Phospholipase DDHD2 n=2 Tax=Cacopsylla melanoneura TaxID=428564 RepID=A0A8D8R8N6_9HEMI
MAPPVAPAAELTNYMIVDGNAGDPHYGYDSTVPTIVSPSESVPQSPSNNGDPSCEFYREVYHHWFFKKITDNKSVWNPFSMADSIRIEEAFVEPSKSQVVWSDGGRYDVTVGERQRNAVYWKEEPTEVRRCSWFYKASLESRYIPYDEKVSDLLEKEYKEAVTTNNWHKTIPLDNGEEVIMYSAKVIVHHIKPDLRLTDFAWDSSSEQSIKPRIVSRGLDMFDISEGEPDKIDHLLFLVHGIGSFCDLKFRPVVEVVDDFRSISLTLTASHFKSHSDSGSLGRVEMLPISWHEALHSDESGIDKKLKAITLPSIPKLRYFTNDTLLDVLFYTSPIYCERIITAVCKEMNRLYTIFQSRNPGYDGGVSMGGHSLGSLILFDLLSHQKPVHRLNSEDVKESATDTEDESSDTLPSANTGNTTHRSRLTKGPSYICIPSEGTSVPYIRYPQLTFEPRIFFAFGSPTGMFVNVRGIDSLGEDFVFPTCPKFYNIFHPFDPVAYRIEPLIVPAMEHVRPVQIPHHKGRKRMHLELKDTLEYVGSALKQKLYDSMKSTWNKVSYLAMLNKSDVTVTQEVTQALEEQLLAESQENAFPEPTQELEPGKTVGKINGGNRVDYVLQEAPLESFNEYLFALSSHVCYWESNDTMLLVLKEIYAEMGFSADSQVPQQILPFDMEETGGTGEATSPHETGIHQGSVLGPPPPATHYM